MLENEVTSSPIPTTSSIISSPILNNNDFSPYRGPTTPNSIGRTNYSETATLGSEHLHSADPFSSVIDPIIEEPSSNSSAVKKIVRLTGSTFSYLFSTVENIRHIPLWSSVDRLVLQCMIIDSECNIGFYTHSILHNIKTYLPFLRQIRESYGIQLYAGLAFPSKYCVEENLTSPHIMAISMRPGKFWKNLDKFLFQYAFDGVELDFQEYTPICRTIYESISQFAYRSKLVLCLPQSEPFIHHYGKLLKSISNLCEGLIINSFGHFKYHVRSPTWDMLPKSDRSYEDSVDLLEAYLEHSIPPSKMFLVFDTSAVVYSIDQLADPTIVDTYSVIPLHQVDRIRRYNEGKGCLEWIDREKLGSLIVVPDEAHEYTRLAISWDNPKMIQSKINLCRDRGLRGIIINDLKDDLPMGSEYNILNNVNKYI